MENKNIKGVSTNKFVVMQEFANDYVREDHYDGKNGVYRFSAIYKFEKESDIDFQMEIIKLMFKLNKFTIKPRNVFIHEDFAEIDWLANGKQVVESKGEYLKLSMQFCEYLDNYCFDGLEVGLSFVDDPYPGDELGKYEPTFSSENFGATNMTLYNLEDKKSVKELEDILNVMKVEVM